VHERQREVEPPPHPAGVAADAPVAGLREPDAVEQLARPRPRRGAAQPVQRALHAQQLAPCHQRVDRGLLQRDADRAPHRVGVADDVVARHARRAGGRAQQRGEDPHRRGLAGPVGTEEPVDLALAHGEVEPVDGADPALELAHQAGDLDGGRALAAIDHGGQTSGPVRKPCGFPAAPRRPPANPHDLRTNPLPPLCL
jgi:hypothetical protein